VFGGIIAYRGRVTAVDTHSTGGSTLRVRCEGTGRERPEPKDSVAIDGVCLTVTAVERDELSFDVVPETLARSTLGDRAAGDAVNVEYALRVGDRIGGHFVYGHVDDAARVLERTPEGQGERLRIETPALVARLIARKGFVAVDGVSLTIASCVPGSFEVALVPETLARTTLGSRPPGSRVNLEADPLARYANATEGEG
jgi:riboflavin synthase